MRPPTEVGALVRNLQARVRAEGTTLGYNMVAFSGGVDSSLVAALVHSVFPGSSMACLGVSPSLPEAQRELAHSVAQHVGIPLKEVYTQEGTDPEYIANRGQSCYHCKTHLYSALEAIAATAAAAHRPQTPTTPHHPPKNILFNGTNADDRRDPTRVGLRAAHQYGVSSPLDALSKPQVRAAARHLGLPNWDAAASPCLRSRLAFGVAATPSALARVEAAERAVRALLSLQTQENMRVRALAGGAALLELDAPRLAAARAALPALAAALLPLGFASLDARAFRSGALSGFAETETAKAERGGAGVEGARGGERRRPAEVASSS